MIINAGGAKGNVGPSWTAPTAYSSRCTVNRGGYWKDGKKVSINMRITSAYAYTSATLTSAQMLTGFPAPEANAVLNCYNHTTGVVIPCYLNTSGQLSFRLGAVKLASGDDIYISGEYFVA